MTKNNSLYLLAVVWGAVLVSVGVLAYALNRPLTVAAARARVVVSESAQPLTELAAISFEATTHEIQAAPVLVVGRVALPAAPPPPRARDLSEMHCASWQDVTQGGGQVRYCE